MFPRVRTVIWFNEHATQWEFDSSSPALAAAGVAFRAMSGPVRR